MRFVATLLVWIVTTVALAEAITTAWAQKNIIDRNGYSAFAASAARDPQLQQAMASELTTQVTALAADNGTDVNSELVRGVATATPPARPSPGSSRRPTRSLTGGCSPMPSGSPTPRGAGRSIWRPCWRTPRSDRH